MELFKAHQQWAKRPADERFESIAALAAATRAYVASARETQADLALLRAQADGGEVRLAGRQQLPARLTHWSFGQLAQRVGAPAAYLRALSPTLAAQNINFGLARLQDAGPSPAVVLTHVNGDSLVRALTTDVYTRIWNADVADRLVSLEGGWRVPPARPAIAGQPGTRPATEADVLQNRSLGLSVQIGDPIAPAGLYASDHDMFAFLVNEDRRIDEPGNPDGLARGFFVWNSEVGNGAWGFCRFLHRGCCGNHIVWGAEEVSEIRIPHVGTADARAFRALEVELAKYADTAASEDSALVASAARFQIAASKDDVLDVLFAKKITTRRNLEAAYTLAEENPIDGSPRSAWGMAQGLTRLSQRSGFADDRVALDRAAGKILGLAF